MATKTIFIPVNDITQGDTFTLLSAIYDEETSVVGESRAFDTAADIIAVYPTFASEITYITNGLNTWVTAYNEAGFPNVIIDQNSDFQGRSGHVLEFSDGTRGTLTMYGLSGFYGWKIVTDAGDVRLTINDFNVNTYVMNGIVAFDGSSLQYTQLFADNIPFPSSTSGFRFVYQGHNVQTLPRKTTPTQIEVDFWTSGKIVTPSSDPYGEGGESDTGGGTGNFDGTSVDIDFASLPTLSAVDTGFISLYNPTLAQLQSLANYMWSDLFDLDTFKKLFGDPMQAILGLSIVPGPVPSGAAQVVKVGNISTGVTMTKAATQYINIDCGTLNVEEFWGAYLDYEPYTKAEIYLPFIGVHQIAVDDIMNKPVHIMYHIDLLSGGCACEIKCGGSVLYTFIGSCAVSIPVTGSDWTNLINGVLSAASAIGTMVATGGASAPAAASTIASAAVNSLKPSIEKSGSIAGAGGLLAGKVPVLILTRPRQALPGKQNTFTGYPAFITRSLGALSGYTEVHSIRLSGIDGTESEIDEIEELLKGGVIF